MFALQSQYDSWQTGHVQGPDGGDAKTQELGNNITSRIQSMLMANNKESGVFLAAFATVVRGTRFADGDLALLLFKNGMKRLCLGCEKVVESKQGVSV